MKVIRQPEPFVPFEAKCPCGAILEVEEDDIRYRMHSDQREGTEEYFYVTCPLCAEVLYVPEFRLTIRKRTVLRKAWRG